MKIVKKSLVTIAGLLLLVCCEDKSNDLSKTNNSIEANQSYTTNTEEKLTPVILGEKLENPFSVENMQLAINSLLEKPEELEGAGVSKRNAEVLEITPTDWYICFKVDSTQFNTLTSDTTLSLTQIPLDYEIEQHGDYLEEFQNSEIKTLYTVVKPGYVNPDGIEFEILDELFIPENSDYYSEGVSESESGMESRSASVRVMDNNFVNALLIQSFVLTGNEKFLPEKNKIEERKMYEECVQKRFLWWSWYDCNTYYYPEGKVYYQTPDNYKPVKGIKIVMWRWFTKIEAITDSNGKFISKTRLNKILIANNVNYYLQMVGQNGQNRWSMNLSLYGSLCLWNDSYYLGNFSPNYNEFRIGVNHKAWGKCIINNAIYDYINIVKEDGLTLPPKNLRIGVYNGQRSSSAPLLTNHTNLSLTCGSKWLMDYMIGFMGEMLAYSLVGWGIPDLMLCYVSNINTYKSTISTIWHELNHSSHLQAMINNKGITYASDYWSHNVYQQAKNATSSSNNSPYGKKGDENWEYIALSEGWANYRQWKLGRQYLKYNSITNVSAGTSYYNVKPSDRAKYLRYRYAGLMNDLNNIIPDKIFEIAISSCNTISELELFLINQRSNYASTIKNKFDKYEKLD